MEPNFPKFILVNVQMATTRTQEIIHTNLDGELNGDKVPDQVELYQNQKENKIGFHLKLGAYARMTKTDGNKPNPLFSQTEAQLSYTTNTIWEVPIAAEGEDGVLSVEGFELNDFNKDGDTDIRFTVRQRINDVSSLSVFVLMNQTILDRELVALPTLPKHAPSAPKGDKKEHNRIEKPNSGFQKLGCLFPLQGQE